MGQYGALKRVTPGEGLGPTAGGLNIEETGCGCHVAFPDGVVYVAFGGSSPIDDTTLMPVSLRQVVWGRLR
jgi:hypothetical protein